MEGGSEEDKVLQDLPHTTLMEKGAAFPEAPGWRKEASVCVRLGQVPEVVSSLLSLRPSLPS